VFFGDLYTHMCTLDSNFRARWKQVWQGFGDATAISCTVLRIGCFCCRAFKLCHLERNMVVGAADGPVESKDPASIAVTIGVSGSSLRDPSREADRSGRELRENALPRFRWLAAGMGSFDSAQDDSSWRLQLCKSTELCPLGQAKTPFSPFALAIFFLWRWLRGLPYRRCDGARFLACPIAVCLWPRPIRP
jgi:hypothetical protein